MVAHFFILHPIGISEEFAVLNFRCEKTIRLIKALQEQGIAYSVSVSLLKKKDVKVNGRRISENIELKSGDFVEVYWKNRDAEPNRVTAAGVKTSTSFERTEAGYGSFYPVFEDERILVVCKGKGLPVVGTKSLTERLRESYGAKIAPCHRLDTNTTGLVLFAKDSETQKYLTDQMDKRRIIKKYKCVVCGIPERKGACLKAFLFKDRRQSRVYVSEKQRAGAMEILTNYRLIKADESRQLALLEVEILTGRTHQIRAHLAAIGHPILGDGKYGRGEINRMYRVDSQMLCAYYLRLDLDDHPDYCSLKGLEFQIKPEFGLIF